MCSKCGRNFGSSEALSMHSEAKHSGHVPAEQDGGVVVRGDATASVVREFEAEKSAGQFRKNVFFGLASLFAIGLVYGFYLYAQDAPPVIGALKSAHVHANWSVVLNGEEIWLENPKYQLRSEFVHLEDGESTIHKHATGITMGYFLNTLGWKFSRDCLQFDDGRKFCNDAANGKFLKFFVNGVQNEKFGRYDFQDNDTIKIIYG